MTQSENPNSAIKEANNILWRQMMQMITKNGRFSKFLAIVMSIAMVLCMMPLTVAMAAEDEPYGRIDVFQEEVIVNVGEPTWIEVAYGWIGYDDGTVRFPLLYDEMTLNGWTWPGIDIQVFYVMHNYGDLEFKASCLDPVEASTYSAEVWLTCSTPSNDWTSGVFTLTVIVPEVIHEHDYTAAVTDPTCTEQGYTTYTCECGDSYIDDYVDALGHDFSVPVEHVDAICESAGYDVFRCSRCEETDVVDIGALGHAWSAVVTEPDCTEIGFTTHVCANDAAHNYTDSYVAELGHDFSNLIGYQAPTHEADGYALYQCSRCDETQLSVIPALDHIWDAVVTDPTCLDEGYTTFTCSDCGEVRVENYLPALGHSFTELVGHQDAACTEDGYDIVQCSRCDVTDTVVLPALGHDWDGGVVTTEPTVDTEGVMTFTCQRCGEIRTESIPKLPGAPEESDVDFLKNRAADILKNGLTTDQLRLDGKTLTLVLDGREFVLSLNANNRNLGNEIDLGGGYFLVFDIKGNGANVKDFKVIQR